MIVSIESNEANASLSTVDRLAGALGVNFSDLVRPPHAKDKSRIESLAWRGAHPDSEAVLLGAAAKTEHVEIAMYEGLITKAQAMGADDIVGLLEENLEQEKHTLEEVRTASQQVSKELATQAA